MSYDGANVLVTGGLGLVGSNLAVRLAQEGAAVTIVDPLLPGCGGNLYNIEPVRDQIRVLGVDIAEAAQFSDVIARSDVIFNLAGEISHIHSMQFPERDLQVNTVAQLRFLLECARVRRGIRVVYAGTRQVYGVPEYLPVDESHPIQPVDFNGVHKYAATMYHLMMSRSGDLDAVVLRLTNVYGPRMALDVACQGFLSTFLRRAILEQPLEVFGSGTQLRDPVFVDDAVDAFCRAGIAKQPAPRSYNVGGGQALTLLDIARIVAASAGQPEPLLRSFPPERAAIDIGSYHTNSALIHSRLGWSPQVGFAHGIARTLEYFQRERSHYLPAHADIGPACRMPEHNGAAHRLQYAPA